MEEKKNKSVLDLIGDAIEILKNSHVFFEIIIKGRKTNIRITKPGEEYKELNRKVNEILKDT